MATAGPVAFQTITNDATAGTYAWSNPSNAGADDSNYATVAFPESDTSQYLKCLNPNSLGITAGSTINQIDIAVKKKAATNTGSNYIVDSEAKLVKAGSIQATNQADTSTHWSTTEATVTYSFSGSGWVDTDFGSTFGFVFKITNGGLSAGQTPSVNYVTCTITYTAPSGAVRRVTFGLSVQERTGGLSEV